MMGALLTNPWVLLGLVIAILAGAGGIYVKGHSDGTAAGEAAQKAAVFEQLKERNLTDEKVQGLSDPDLCNALGGKLLDNRCQ